jgi:hypothetical protein
MLFTLLLSTVPGLVCEIVCDMRVEGMCIDLLQTDVIVFSQSSIRFFISYLLAYFAVSDTVTLSVEISSVVLIYKYNPTVH